MKIIREYRKTLSLRISSEGEIIVKAPYFLSMKKIEEFVSSKRSWIIKQLEIMEEKEQILTEFNFSDNVYIDGNRYIWKETQKDLRETKASFYKKHCKKLIDRAEECAKKLGISATFKICTSKRIWGSCDNKHSIKLNWKLILLPISLQEYVIYHELCHTKQMNHSKKFWSEVESIVPKYKEMQNQLKSLSLLLQEDVI